MDGIGYIIPDKDHVLVVKYAKMRLLVDYQKLDLATLEPTTRWLGMAHWTRPITIGKN